MADCKLKLRKIAVKLKIPESRVFTILREHLSMRNLCSNWVRVCSQSIENDKTSTIQSVVSYCFNAVKRSFCINMRQWMTHGSTTSLRSQIDSQLSVGKSHPMSPKTQTSDGKVLASVFWNAQGILFINYFEKGRTINSEYYIASLIRLKEEIAKERPQMKKKKLLFHQDNVPCHKSIATTAKLNELHFKLLPHQPYSLDLVPIDYWLFADSKRMLQGKRFGFNEKVISETEAYFEAKDKSFNKKGIELLEKCWNSVYHPRRRLCWWIKSNFA